VKVVQSSFEKLTYSSLFFICFIFIYY